MHRSLIFDSTSALLKQPDEVHMIEHVCRSERVLLNLELTVLREQLSDEGFGDAQALVERHVLANNQVAIPLAQVIEQRAEVRKE